MNNRWRKQYFLKNGKKLSKELKETAKYWDLITMLVDNPPRKSFRKGAKHYATKRR